MKHEHLLIIDGTNFENVLYLLRKYHQLQTKSTKKNCLYFLFLELQIWKYV